MKRRRRQMLWWRWGGLWPLFAATLCATNTAAAAPLGDSPFGLAVAAGPGGPGQADARRGNRAVLVDNGNDALMLRVHLIRAARRTIEIQTFIWSDDACGRLLIYELIAAAKRGVQVRIIADQMASAQDPAKVAFLDTVDPHFQVRHYRPSLARLRPSVLQTMLAGVRSFHGVNQRMHNKLMVFDDAAMITGGRNIENTYFDHAEGLNFRDRDILVIGPAAKVAAASFERYWHYRMVVRGEDLKDVAAVIARGDCPRYAARKDYDFGPFFGDEARLAQEEQAVAVRLAAQVRPVARVRFIADDPGKTRGFFAGTARITRELRALAAGARTSLVMQTPYLILSRPARKLARELRSKHPGLRIRISTNSFASTDNLLAYSANYRLRGVYVEDLGLEIHEFRPRPASLRALFPGCDAMAARAKADRADGPAPYLCVHAKSLVVDDRLAFVGSYNLDPRSENLNTEVGVIVEDAALAHELRRSIEADMAPGNSWVIGRRALPLHLEAVNSLVDGLLSLSPLDIWPIQNTSSFELIPGQKPVPPDDPDFHRHYREVGSFPGTDGWLSTKEILTRIYKAVGAPLTPIM
jgi:phosphatidylserine/phosphatidylglycerophosphate/cardiolipin synthase-like enzyme